MRQTAFDNWETTDDHGMVIYGIAKDQNGKEYFMVKNSWGTSGKYKGIWYASKAFVAYKTMNILVHKDALPKEIAKETRYQIKIHSYLNIKAPEVKITSGALCLMMFSCIL